MGSSPRAVSVAALHPAQFAKGFVKIVFSAIPTVCLSNIPLVYCHINSFQRASGLARPSQGGEKRTAVWTSHHKERCSDRVVAPPVCDHMIVPHRWVVLDGCNPSGSAVDAGRDAAARARRAERVVEAVLCPFCRPSMGRPVHRELMRNESRNLGLSHTVIS